MSGRSGRGGALPAVGRRGFLGGMAGLAAGAALPGAAFGRARGRRVLMHRLTLGDFAHLDIMQSGNPFWRQAAEDLVALHARTERDLLAEGAEVLRLEDALDGAIREALRRGTFESWARRIYPDLPAVPAADAAAFLGRAGERHPAAAQASLELAAIRDFAGLTDATPAHRLLRFAVTEAPELASCRLAAAEPGRATSDAARCILPLEWA